MPIPQCPRLDRLRSGTTCYILILHLAPSLTSARVHSPLQEGFIQAATAARQQIVSSKISDPLSQELLKVLQSSLVPSDVQILHFILRMLMGESGMLKQHEPDVLFHYGQADFYHSCGDLNSCRDTIN